MMPREKLEIFGVTEQLEYISYWNEEYIKLSNMIKQLPPESVSAQAEELKKISRIKDEIGSFLHIVSDRNIPAEDVYDQINKRLEECDNSFNNERESVKLGVDAIALLISVCNASGMMLVSTSLEAYSIVIDDSNFVDCSSLDNRTVSRWKDAISKLEYYGLIETENNYIYRITKSGYKASEDLEKQIGTEKVKCNNCHYNGASDKKDVCPICKNHIGGKEQVVLEAIKNNPNISRREIAELLGCSDKSTARILKNMMEDRMIERIGSLRNGSWKIV